MIHPWQLKPLNPKEVMDLFRWDRHGYGNSTSDSKRYTWVENRARLLRGLKSTRALANVLRTPIHDLEALVQAPDYRSFIIPKKRGGFREVQAPSDDLKPVQDRLRHYLDCYYRLIRPSTVHGFVRRMPSSTSRRVGIVSNAKAHVGKETVLNIDIKDFFPSISTRQVYALFKGEFFEYPDNLAQAMALLCTYEGKLPTGAPTSPVISNLVCFPLDRALSQYALDHDLTYTRYADDLTFSAHRKLADDTVLDIVSILGSHGFRINPNKLRKQGRGGRQQVTGLVVNEKVSVPRKTRKLLRAMKHDAEMNGVEAAAKRHFKLDHTPSFEEVERFRQKVNGLEGFVGMVG